MISVVRVNGETVPHRPFRDPLLERIGVSQEKKAFWFLETEPLHPGDDIVLNAIPDGIEEIWVRFPFEDFKGTWVTCGCTLTPLRGAVSDPRL